MSTQALERIASALERIANALEAPQDQQFEIKQEGPAVEYIETPDGRIPVQRASFG